MGRSRDGGSLAKTASSARGFDRTVSISLPLERLRSRHVRGARKRTFRTSEMGPGCVKTQTRQNPAQCHSSRTARGDRDVRGAAEKAWHSGEFLRGKSRRPRFYIASVDFDRWRTAVKRTCVVGVGGVEADQAAARTSTARAIVVKPDRSGGSEFSDHAVAAAYVHRPEYPPALYDALLALMPSRSRVLDLGTGPGKIARALAPHVGEVLAVDPSAAMLKLALNLDAGAHSNIRWINAAAENLTLDDGSLDLAVAGAAIHWMDASIIFPKIAQALSLRGCIAVVEGDAPTTAPWLSTYLELLRAWVARLGGVWDGADHRLRRDAHLPWLRIAGEATFEAAVRQPLDDFIECEHSRATWSRARMGDLAAEFDNDLRSALTPWAVEGVLEFAVATDLTYGHPLAVPLS